MSFEKCLESKPVTKEYAKSLAEKGKAASPAVTQSLLGMLFRGDSLKEFKPVKKSKPKRKAVCSACNGHGKLTDDQFRMTEEQIVQEIANDRKSDPASAGRTEIALENGSITFADCIECGGEGKL